MKALSHGEIEITVVTSKRGTAVDKIAQAVQFGHGILRVRLVRPDGSVMRLKVLDMDYLESTTYRSLRTQ